SFIFVHITNKTCREICIGFIVFLRTLDDLVINVSDIAHIGNIPALGTQKTCHYIKGYQHASVTDMAIIIDSDTTDVHGNLARLQWLENFFLASQGVVYM